MLGAFGGYIFSSVLFFAFPLIFHKKKKQHFQARHISHRGGAGERMENTLPAFRNALRCGTDMFEIDLHLTNDGELVVSHDDDLQTLTGKDVTLSDCNYNEIPLLNETLKVTFSKDASVKSCEEGDRRIPLFRFATLIIFIFKQ